MEVMEVIEVKDDEVIKYREWYWKQEGEFRLEGNYSEKLFGFEIYRDLLFIRYIVGIENERVKKVKRIFNFYIYEFFFIEVVYIYSESVVIEMKYRIVFYLIFFYKLLVMYIRYFQEYSFILFFYIVIYIYI